MTDRAFYLKPAFVASGVFLALLGLAAAAVFASGGDDKTATAGARVPARAPGRLMDTGGSRCGLPVGPTDRPVGPPTASWTLIGTVAAPSSPVFGPGIEDGHQRVCFAHSATGALFAAASAIASLSAYGTDLALMREILAQTPARDVLMRQNGQQGDDTVRAQFAGFHVTAINRDYVVVDLVMRTNVNSVLAALTLPMRWENRPREGGDWRLLITNVDQPYAITAGVSLTNYVRWDGA